MLLSSRTGYALPGCGNLWKSYFLLSFSSSFVKIKDVFSMTSLAPPSFQVLFLVVPNTGPLQSDPKGRKMEHAASSHYPSHFSNGKATWLIKENGVLSCDSSLLILSLIYCSSDLFSTHILSSSFDFFSFSIILTCLHGNWCCFFKDPIRIQNISNKLWFRLYQN